MTCTYCNHPIIEYEPGYGFYGDEPNEVVFHMECIEIEEGVVMV